MKRYMNINTYTIHVCVFTPESASADRGCRSFRLSGEALLLPSLAPCGFEFGFYIYICIHTHTYMYIYMYKYVHIRIYIYMGLGKRGLHI